MSNEGDGDPLVDLRSFLQEKAKAPAPGRTRSLKEMIAALRPQLVELKDAGYTDAGIVDLLKEKGIVIGAGTLKNYMSQTRDTTTASQTKSRRTSTASTGNRNANTPDTKPQSPAAPPVASTTTGAPGEPKSLTRNPRKPL